MNKKHSRHEAFRTEPFSCKLNKGAVSNSKDAAMIFSFFIMFSSVMNILWWYRADQSPHFWFHLLKQNNLRDRLMWRNKKHLWTETVEIGQQNGMHPFKCIFTSHIFLFPSKLHVMLFSWFKKVECICNSSRLLYFNAACLNIKHRHLNCSGAHTKSA